MTNKDKLLWDNFIASNSEELGFVLLELAEKNVRNAIALGNFIIKHKIDDQDIAKLLRLEAMGMNVSIITSATDLYGLNNLITSFLETVPYFDIDLYDKQKHIEEPLKWNFKRINFSGIEWTSNSWCLKTRSHFRNYVEDPKNYQIVAIRNWALPIIPKSHEINDIQSQYKFERFCRLGITINPICITIHAAHDNYNGSIYLNNIQNMMWNTVITDILDKQDDMFKIKTPKVGLENLNVLNNTTDKIVIFKSTDKPKIRTMVNKLVVAKIKPNSKFGTHNLNNVTSIWVYTTRAGNILMGLGESETAIQREMGKGKVLAVYNL